MYDPICTWPDCDRPHFSRGFCTRDLRRAEKVGTWDEPWLRWKSGREGPRSYPSPKRSAPCRWPGCEMVGNQGAGLCRRCSQRANAVGDFDQPWEIWNRRPTCFRCDKPVTGRQRNAKWCSERCAVKAWQEANRDRYLELGRRHASRRRAQILAVECENFTEADVRMTYGDDCYLCDGRINFRLRWPNRKSPSLDHVQPLSRGGAHALSNVAMTHLDCNMRKNASEASSAPMATLFAT